MVKAIKPKIKFKYITPMEVKIKYSELQDFILHNFNKEVSLAFVAPSTVSVSTKIKF